MHIVIPMSGIGKRFIDGGYDVPKPLIEIDGKPIIQYVVELFPGESKFTFICNELHFETTDMRDTLLRIAPQCEIVSIPSHVLGPVYTVSRIMDELDDDEEIIVNYCDFGTYWDYQEFLAHTRNRNADGAIISYKGFHPHMLGATKYATIREDAQWMLEIKEKGSFTNDRMQEFVSNGTYYFKKGSYIKKYFKEMMDKDISLNGEFYVSLIYNLLVHDGLTVSIYDIQHMLQWGEPHDFASYRSYSNYFKKNSGISKDWFPQKKSVSIIPLIENNIVFEEAGYTSPGYLLPISGYPMFVQSLKSLPKSEKYLFMVDKKYNDKFKVESVINKEFSSPISEVLSSKEKPDIVNVIDGISHIDDDSPLLVCSPYNSVQWDNDNYMSLVSDETIDVLLWVAKGNPLAVAKPELFNWVKVKGSNVVSSVLFDTSSEDLENSLMLIDVYYFKNCAILKKYYTEMNENVDQYGDITYMSLINFMIGKGLNVKVFKVDTCVNWGRTPGDYETFRYWQSFFHKYNDHPYSVENDPIVNKNSMNELTDSFTSFKQKYI